MSDIELKYGFRCDPMEFVENDRTWRGAMARHVVFGKPARGDRALLDAMIEEFLENRRKDGGLDAEGAVRLLLLDCLPDRPEMKQAVRDTVRRAQEKDGTTGAYGLQALCLLGGDDSEVAKVRDASLRKIADECRRGCRGGCPWTPSVQLRALWTARRFGDVDDAIENDLSWIADGMNEIGCMSYKDPWGYLDLAGSIDHPLGRKIVQKQIPLILRGQRPDGRWGGGWTSPGGAERTTAALRALARYGLLEELRSLPPLPPDWKVVRSIPAPPEGEARFPDRPPGHRAMTYGRDRLWVYSPREHAAIAVSPEDGEVVKRLPLPGEQTDGIGWWDDCLALVTDKLLQVDPETGEVRREVTVKEYSEPHGIDQVNDKVWVADGFEWVVMAVDAKAPGKAEFILLGCPTGGWGSDIAAAGDGVWHFERSLPFLVKTDAKAEPIGWNEEAARTYRNAAILDWGEKPFGESTTAIAHDGENLWALDRDNHRICIIEKTKSDKEMTDPLAVRREQEN